MLRSDQVSSSQMHQHLPSALCVGCPSPFQRKVRHSFRHIRWSPKDDADVPSRPPKRFARVGPCTQLTAHRRRLNFLPARLVNQIYCDWVGNLVCPFPSLFTGAPRIAVFPSCISSLQNPGSVPLLSPGFTWATRTPRKRGATGTVSDRCAEELLGQRVSSFQRRVLGLSTSQLRVNKETSWNRVLVQLSFKVQ